MIQVGLTGNIASGKSTVAGMLADFGATVIDADVLARQAVEPGSAALKAIRNRFGDAYITSDGQLDRKALGRMVFRDDVARRDLNGIVHPEVGRLRVLATRAASDAGASIVVSDIPLLFETRAEELFDAVVLVDAPEHDRLHRLVTFRGLPEADARAMMSAQWSSAEKRALATFIIDNDGSVEELQQRVAAVWRELEALASRS
jgi:dephospho-CoA kinase